MSKIKESFEKISQLLEPLKIITKDIIKEEELEKKHLLVKEGFLIRRYSIKTERIDLRTLERLKEEIKNVKKNIENISYLYRNIRNNIFGIEKEYLMARGKKLNSSKIFKDYLNDVLYLSGLALAQIDEMIINLNNKENIKKYKLGNKINKTLNSFEKIINKIMQFIDIMDQLSLKIISFEVKDHYEVPKMYGRAMSIQEARKMKSKQELIGSRKRTEGDLVAVFDANSSVIKKIDSLTTDEKKNFFGQIGVVGATNIVYFQTRLKPAVGPVPQSNGLREYKFLKGTPIEYLEAA